MSKARSIFLVLTGAMVLIPLGVFLFYKFLLGGNVVWMAWTTETAIFFAVIAGLLLLMTLWEVAVPGGDPRRGVLGLDTTRGDRLFISLLGSAFINLAWLAAFGHNLWPALAVSIVYALAVFRWV